MHTTQPSSVRWNLFSAVWLALCLAAVAPVTWSASAAEPAEATRAAASETRRFDLPGDAAARTLKQFSEQAGAQVLFPTESVEGVTTNAVRGEFTPLQALERMVSGTPLSVVRDEKTGALGLKRTGDPRRSRAGADEVPAGATGTISGRVQNLVTGQYLNNVRLVVRGTSLIAFTDQSGSYRLARVPSGPVVLEVFYTGLDPQQIPLHVPAGQNLEHDVRLTSESRYGDAANTVTVTFDAFVVTSAKQTDGEAIATNEQRFSPNIKNVVAANALGDITEGNVAEFMKFLPGITVNYENVTPNTVSVRGFPDYQTSVLVDGAQYANAAGNGASRAFQFKQVSINNISRIEVTKLPTPAMPADSLAGSVNMVSKSAFERSGAQFNYRLYLSANGNDLTFRKTPFPYEKNTYKMMPSFDFDYTLPINKRLGVVVSGLASSQFNEQNLSTYTFRADGTGTGATPDKPYLRTYALTDAPKYLYRDSLSIRTDWRATSNLVLTVNAQTNYYRDDNANFVRTWDAGGNGTPTIASGLPLSYGADNTIGATGRGAVTQAGSFHTVQGASTAGNILFRFDDGDWRVYGGIYRSDSRTWRRYMEKFQALTTSLLNPVRVSFESLNPTRPGSISVYDNNNQLVDVDNLANYRLNTATANPIFDVRENIPEADLNIRKSLNFLPFSTAIQVGGMGRVQTRDIKRQNINWTYNGINGDLTPAPYASVVYRNRENEFGFDNIVWASPVIAWEKWPANPGLFTKTAAQTVSEETFRINNSQRIQETVAACYAQLEMKLFKERLNLVTGIRYEKTTDKGMGPLSTPAAAFVRDASGGFAHDTAGNRIRKPEAGAAGSLEELTLTLQERASRATRDYDGYYPSIHVTYKVRENFLIRAAFAQTYGRPDFTQIIPTTTIAENDLAAAGNPAAFPGTITTTNTGLKPWAAKNYDLTMEYYTDQGGLFSTGVFRKDINDFFATSTKLATLEDLADLGLDPQFVGWNLSTSVNAGDARVDGLEFNFRHSLQPLGGWGRYFTLFVNGTRLSLKGRQQSSFIGFIPKTMNWGVTFNRKPIMVMANWNYRGRQFVSGFPALGPDASAYQPGRTTLTMNLSYLWRKHLSFFMNARNIFDVEEKVVRFGPSTPAYARFGSTNEYGVQIAIGIKGTY